MNLKLTLIRIGLLGMLVAGLTACSTFSGEADGLPVAELIPLDNPKPIFTSQWQQRVGRGQLDHALRLAPAIGSSKGHVAIFTADAKGQVDSTALTTGQNLWTAHLPEAVFAGVGSGEGVVLVVLETGVLVALEADSGEQLWQQTLYTQALAPPQVGNGVAVVHGIDSRLMGFSLADGELLWEVDGRSPALTLHGSSKPTIVSDIVLAGFANGRVGVYSVRDGRSLWEYPVAIGRGRSEIERLVDINGDIAVDGGVVYVVSYQGRVMALEIQSAQVLWEREMSSTTGVVAGQSAVYLSDADGVLWALNKQNGRTLWQQDGLLRRGLTRPTVVDDYLVVGDYQGYLQVLDKTTGQVLNYQQLDKAGIVAPPLVIGMDRVVVLGAGGQLIVLSLML